MRYEPGQLVDGSDNRTYEINEAGLAILIGRQDYDDFGCECEIDWNCGHCGGTSRATFIERGY